MQTADEIISEINKTRKRFLEAPRKIKMKKDVYEKIVTKAQEQVNMIRVVDITKQPLNTLYGLEIEIDNSIEKDWEVFYVRENDEALKAIGKRYMLWNIQRQVYALKLKDRTVTEEWLIDILDSLEKMQLVEEDNWNTKKYIESEIEQDMIRESKILNKRIREMIK